MAKFIEEFYYGNIDPKHEALSRIRLFKSRWKS